MTGFITVNFALRGPPFGDATEAGDGATEGADGEGNEGAGAAAGEAEGVTDDGAGVAGEGEAGAGASALIESVRSGGGGASA